jgi:hypothetical protein
MQLFVRAKDEASIKDELNKALDTIEKKEQELSFALVLSGDSLTFI